MGARLKFYKTSDKCSYLNMADSYARLALNMKPNDKMYWFMESKDAEAVEIEYIESIQDYSNALYVLDNINEMKSETFSINIKDIELIEAIHLKAISIDLGGDLYNVSKGKVNQRPIIVRTIGKNKYGLVSGFKRYCIAK